MRTNPIAAAFVALAAIVVLIGIVLYVRGVTGGATPEPVPANTAGPAEAGALETGGALKPEEGYKSMPPREMPRTISSYPPPAGAAASEPAATK